VAQVSRWRAVVEDMTQMGVTPATENFFTLHTERVVPSDRNIFLRHRLPETWPSRSRLELGLRIKENCIAANAVIEAIVMVVRIFAGARTFSARLASDRELLRGQLLLPFHEWLFDLLYRYDSRPYAGWIELDDMHVFFRRRVHRRRLKGNCGRHGTC